MGWYHVCPRGRDRGCDRVHSSDPAPGTGLGTPETGSPKSTLSRPQRAAETARPKFEPRKRPQIVGSSSETGKRRFAQDCVVETEGLKLRAYHALRANRSLIPSDLKKLRISGHFCEGGMGITRNSRSKTYAASNCYDSS
jgi:hypothetical protein